MAGELRIVYAPGAVVYRHLLNTSSRRYNGSAFEAYASSDYDTYSELMVEDGSSGVYLGDFPAAITDGGQYGAIYYLAESGTPAEGDHVVGTGTVEWNGSGIETEVEGTVTGELIGSDWLIYVLRSFKRTDKNTEVFDATNAAIAEIRRKMTTQRDEKDTESTDTIDTLGEYRLDLETDYGLAISDVFIRDENDGRMLVPISKFKYDMLYGIWGSSASMRDQPRHYCVFGGQLLLGPIPDKTSYTYVLTYGRGNLTAVDSSTLSVPYTTPDYREILRDGTLWRLYKLVENDDQASAYRTMWLDGLFEIERRERKNRQVTRVVEYRDC